MPRQATDLQTYSVFAFDRGLDVKTSPLKRAVATRQESLVMARNCVLSTAGAVSKRLDVEKVNATTVGAAVAITGGVEFVKSDGTRIEVFGTNDGKIFKLVTGTATAIDTGNTAGTKWYFAQYNDLLIMANRVDAPQKWDGTTVAALGGSPPAKGGPVVVHGNRVFFLDGTNKSRLTWSALDDEEDYTTASNAGNVDVSLNDGSDLLNLVPSVNELVLLKGARPYRLQGTSPATFTITNVVPTTGSVGTVSTQAALFALNDVWYLGTPGITRLTAVQGFGDLRESFPSAPIQPYFEGETDYTLSLANLAGGVMAYDSQRNRIYVAVDNNADAKNDMVLVYDGATKGWTTWEDVTGGVASMWPVKNTVTGQTEMHYGGYDGFVRVFNRSVAVNAIDAEARHLSALGAPGVEKSVRHGFLYLREQGNTTVTVDTKFDFGATGGQTFSVSQLGGSHTLGVNWVLGQDPLGVQDQIIKRINIHGTGEFVEIGMKNKIAGEGFTWYGYRLHYRVKRVVGRGTGVLV
jgi:hypothetical protein